jgi:hypothetical protein
MAKIYFALEDANGEMRELVAYVTTQDRNESFSHQFGTDEVIVTEVKEIDKVVDMVTDEDVTLTDEMEQEIYENEDQLN